MSTDNDRVSFSLPKGGPALYGIIGVVVAALLLLVLTFTVFIPQSVTSQGNTREAKMNADYADGANFLSNCVVKTKQAANAANANAEAFDRVIKDAVAGSGTAAHVDMNTPASRNSLFPIWVQAYPDLKGQTDLFNKAMDVIVGCQDDYKNKQSVILDGVRRFDTWQGGSWKVRTFGGNNFPNERLFINLPGLTLTGPAALAKMRSPIVDSDTANAYVTGEQDASNPFATPTK
jgi:hypothetical protein